MAYFKVTKKQEGGGGGDTLKELVETVPIGVLPMYATGSFNDNPGEHTVNLGTGHTKVKIIVAYYGPGAGSGQTISGTINFSINDTAVTLTRSEVRDTTLFKACEYWEGDINPETNVQTIAFSASGYSYNGGSKITAVAWVI